MKRGIAPIISLIILIGLVVVGSTIVTLWGYSYVSDITSSADESSVREIICTFDMDLRMKSSCFDEKGLRFIAESKGEQDIKDFIVQIEHPEKSLSLRTTEGLKAFGIKTFRISSDEPSLTEGSKDELRILEQDQGFYEKISNVRLIPIIVKEGVELACKNHYVGNNRISCCPGSTACTCEDGCNPPADICLRSEVDEGRCVECYGDNIDNCVPPKKYCDLSNFKCVECFSPNDCGTGRTCVDGTCQEIIAGGGGGPAICDSVQFEIEDVGQNSLCMDGETLRLKIKNIIAADKMRIQIGGIGYDRQINVVNNGDGNEIILNLNYGVDILRNSIPETLIVTPMINNQACLGKTITNTFLFAGSSQQNGVVKCCNQAIQCNIDGEPTSQQGCCEKDCGQNRFINTEAANPLSKDECQADGRVWERLCPADPFYQVLPLDCPESKDCDADKEICLLP